MKLEQFKAFLEQLGHNLVRVDAELKELREFKASMQGYMPMLDEMKKQHDAWVAAGRPNDGAA